jgi:putative ABC transport system permease protein
MSRFPSLAVRNVSRNRRRSAITLAAILLGVTVITLMRGFTGGFMTLMVEDVVKGRTGALQIHRSGYMDTLEAIPTKLNMPYSPELIGKVMQVKGVTGVTGRIQFSGLVGNGMSQTMFVGRGLDLENEKKACPRSGTEVKEGGQPLAAGDYAHALVGYELAQSFHLDHPSVDSVNLQTSSPEGRANSMDLKVKGLSASNFPFENKRVVTLPLKTAQELLGMQDRVTEYAVGIADLSEVERVADDVRAVLGDGYEVHTWPQLQPFVRDIINRQNIVLGGVAVVLFVIVLTGIINTMLMSVFERVREIGTMLAVGVKRRQILQLFILEAGVIGVIGGALGALLGRGILLVLATRGIPIKLAGTSGESMLRPEVSVSFVLMAIVIAILGALVAAAYPAWRASRMNPVDALRSA